MTINTDTAGESYYPNTNNRLGQLIPCRLLLESVEGGKLCKQTSQSTNAVCTQLCRQGPVSISQILPPLLRGKALCTKQTRCRDSNMLVGTRHDQKLHHVPTTRKNSCQYQLHQAVMAQPHCIRASIFIACKHCRIRSRMMKVEEKWIL